MSLSSIMSIATAGMQVAQTGLSTVSDNISNVNTAGYVRKVVDQSSSAVLGLGTGVTVAQVKRVADQYLQAASISATASSKSAAAVADLLDQAQSVFGDPSSATSYFNQLNNVFSAFTAAANDPASSLNRSQVIDQVNQFLNATQRISASLQGFTQQADTQISSDVDQVNQLLSQIDGLNIDITRALSNGSDATGAMDAQSQLVDKLSGLIDVKISPRQGGGVVLRTNAGDLLAGDGGPATLAYTASGNGAGVLSLTQFGSTQATGVTVSNGELRGLLDVRQNQLPAIQDQLGEFVSKTVDAINQASNSATAVPPPNTLTGRDTGLDLPTAISNFSGKTSLAIVDSSGMLQEQVDIDFTAGTMSVNGGAATGFTPANFLSSLNTALGAFGSASFSNGALSISAASAGNGVAIADDPTTPSSKAGRDFSQFFGLNDLITTSGITNYATGLTASDPSGYTPGDTITFRISATPGSVTRDISVAVPAGGTVGNLISALNAQVGGVGQYGQFVLDSQGALTFQPNTPGAVTLTVLDDNTQRGVGGPSVSQLFGIGSAQRASRAGTFKLSAAVQANPMLMPLAKLNLANAASSQPVVALGDNSGALALAKASSATMNFSAAGDLAATATSATQYGSLFSGSIGRKAAAADDAKTAADAVKTEADTRRASVEGVNLDEELVNLTTYQQAYSASA
ncbi:MAG: flagellar hook-associated protein FlgK, partial [Proteobacteria bacterium]|nr:flagellar hook-associated protein FlgK [Pseudomonadota bacterium]